MNVRLSVALAAAVLLSACAADIRETEAKAAAVKSVTAEEVRGCAYLGDLKVRPRITMENARFDLKLAAAESGATHIIETAAYALPLHPYGTDLGYVLTARKYKCRLPAGPSVRETFVKVPYDLPNPSVNSDDSFFSPYQMIPLYDSSHGL